MEKSTSSRATDKCTCGHDRDIHNTLYPSSNNANACDVIGCSCQAFFCHPQPQLLKDAINPSHYIADNGLECIQVIESFKLNYNLGNALAYIIRSGKKGPAAEDLCKAIWFLKREMKRYG